MKIYILILFKTLFKRIISIFRINMIIRIVSRLSKNILDEKNLLQL